MKCKDVSDLIVFKKERIPRNKDVSLLTGVFIFASGDALSSSYLRLASLVKRNHDQSERNFPS